MEQYEVARLAGKNGKASRVTGSIDELPHWY